MKIHVRSGLYTLIPIFSLLLLLLLFPPGCKNYNQVDLYPPCDTVNISYSSNILPIISANCLPCHTSINQFGGVILDNPDSARIPARNGLLLKAVTHDPSVVPMPKGGSKLSDCDISKIRSWINHGEPVKQVKLFR
ncbi:MAG: cytochrome c [Bacteroidales bacterium]|jgi:hypothetical protein|nr:cytochrome c [Bacteroidales bacterium]